MAFAFLPFLFLLSSDLSVQAMHLTSIGMLKSYLNGVVSTLASSVKAGIDALWTANEHILRYGMEGYIAKLSDLERLMREEPSMVYAPY